MEIFKDMWAEKKRHAMCQMQFSHIYLSKKICEFYCVSNSIWYKYFIINITFFTFNNMFLSSIKHWFLVHWTLTNIFPFSGNFSLRASFVPSFLINHDLEFIWILRTSPKILIFKNCSWKYFTVKEKKY